MTELDNKEICYLMQALSMDLQLKHYKALDVGSKRVDEYETDEI
jgi:hypothetical protein